MLISSNIDVTDRSNDVVCECVMELTPTTPAGDNHCHRRHHEWRHFATSLLNCFNLPSQIDNNTDVWQYRCTHTLSIFVLFGHKLPETPTTSTVRRVDQLLNKWHSWRREWYWSSNTTCHYCHYSNVSTLDFGSQNNLHDFIKYQNLTAWSWKKFQEALDI